MRVLVTGVAGQVGREVAELLLTEHDVLGLAHADLDVTNPVAVGEAVTAFRPESVVHCAAFTAVDRCESERETAFGVNETGTRNVMTAARSVGAFVVTISTDYVFDGTKPDPYVEDDEPNPLSVYGQSKLAGERAVGLEAGDAAILRTSWVCGRYGANMVKTILRLAGEHETLQFVSDQRGHPTIAADLARVCVRFAVEQRPGLFHVTNQGAVSWHEFAQEVLRAAGDDPERVKPITTAELQPPRPAPRPANSVLENRALREAGIELLPDFRKSLRDLVGRL